MKLTLTSPDNPLVREALDLPLLGSLSCGFPSPAGDYEEKTIDLQEFLVPRPSSTFLAWSSGTSLLHKGIPHKALLIIDASVKERHDDVIAVTVDGEFTCKVYDEKANALTGMNGTSPIRITEGNVEIFGVVMKAVNVLCMR